MVRFRFVLFIALALPAALHAIDPKAATPPEAKKVMHKEVLHGDTRLDDYFWMKDKTNPEVIKHLEAENAYTAAVMKSTEPLQQTLYQEFLARIKQTDLSVPYYERGYWYYNRLEEGKQYAIHCRKKGSHDAAEEIILDVNELGKGEKFLSVGGLHVSDDGNLLAFSSDTTGFREYYLSVKNLKSGEMIHTRFAKASQAQWAADNQTLFYVTEDDAKRSHKLWRHTLGQPKDKDTLVYEEKDELFRLGLSRSRDRKFLFHSSHSATTGEQRYLPADQPTGEWKTFAPRSDGHDYSADHRDGQFYIRTNREKATNFKLMTCPVTNTSADNWKEFLPYNPAIMVNGISLFKEFAVISEREAGNPHLRVFHFSDGKQYRIEFPEPVYSASLSANPEFDNSAVHLSYTSLVTPSSVYEYDLAKKTRKLLKQTEVPGGYNPDDYVSERVYASAVDGTKVPVSLVYKKGVKKDGSAPCLLYGYGSYGSTLPVGFSSTRLPLLDRGVIYAQAHIRGGSDLGRQWYDDGKMLKKLNTFTDFIACADFLVNERFCARDRLVIQGGSAGGLLVGATINLRPDLCKAAVLQVPFVDVINTMLDESLPLTIQEFLEWGNPKKKEEYAYLMQYSPYDNLKKAAYPAILVTTSLNDSQVLFHEPTKYVARMRELNPGNTVVFKCNMAGGHGGSSGRYDALKEQAFVMSFVLDQMKIGKPQPPEVSPPPRLKLGPIDVGGLVRKPLHEAIGVTRRYEVDRGALMRTYAVEYSPVRTVRLRKFHADWIESLKSVDFGTVSPEAREELVSLRAKVEDELNELNRRAADTRRIAPLIPFAATIIDLEESRRRVEPVEAMKTAGRVDALRKQVEKLRATLDAGRKSSRFPEELTATQWSATRAAEATDSLRASLRTWHSFYAGYDPDFTWWLAEPYRLADVALGDYSKSLRESARTLPDPERIPAPRLMVEKNSVPSDAPDLTVLLGAPRSEFASVFTQYGRGRTDQTRWLAGLKDVKFNELSRDAKVDYLLFKVHLEREVRRQELRASGANRPPIPKDDSGISGRPLGRDALLAELAGEMIPYTPEELIELARKELNWCDSEMLKASREMGHGDDWRAALEKVKQSHVRPGEQPKLIRDLSDEAIEYLRKNDLLSLPPLAEETWRMIMMTPERQLYNPFFTGGEVISVSFPTNTMSHDAKLQSLRGNNIHFARATVHHELIPGHHLQTFMNARYQMQRGLFGTPFSIEGWALYWELVLYDKGFPKSPEDKIGFLTWRKHRCARIIFSLGYHLGSMTPRECIALLTDRVGFEPENAAAEVRRSFGGGYAPLYQAAYLLGGFQFWELRKELVGTGKMTERQFHDAILREHSMPVAMVRAILTNQSLSEDGLPPWRFSPDIKEPASSPMKGR